MTTRRDVLTGLAALPITATTGSEAGAVPAEDAAAVKPKRPQFMHGIDGRLFTEIDTMEKLLARTKAQLLAANHPHPMIRSGALLEMRCTFNAFCLTSDFARREVESQRVRAEEAAHLWKAQNEPKTGEPDA